MWKPARHPLRYIGIRVVIGSVSIAMYAATVSHLPPPSLESDTRDIIETATIVASPTTVGVSDPQLYGMTPADINTTLNALQSIGVQDIRIDIPWAAIEPVQGSFDWTNMDNIVNAAAARGMGVEAFINQTPAWAGTYLVGNPNPAVFGQFAGQVATRYAGKISAYEIQNEPNAASGSFPVDPVNYTQQLQAAYTAIKSADPSATVIAGVLAAVVTVPGLTTDPVTYVQQMYQAGAKGYFDAMSFHPYQWTSWLNVLTGQLGLFSQGASTPTSPLNQLLGIRQVMVANGDSNKLIWATEYGQPSAIVGNALQAQYISDLLNAWKSYNYTGPVFIYTAQDNISNPNVNTFGIFNADWTPKPAATVVQEAIAGTLPPSPPSPPAPPNPLTALGDALQSWFQAAGQSYSTTLQVISGWLAVLFPASTPAATTAATPTTLGPQAVTSAAASPNAADPPAASVAPDVQQPVIGSGVQGTVTKQPPTAGSSSQSTTTGQTPSATATGGTLTADSGKIGNTAGTTTPGTTGTTTATAATGTTHGTGVSSGTSEGSAAAATAPSTGSSTSGQPPTAPNAGANRQHPHDPVNEQPTQNAREGTAPSPSAGSPAAPTGQSKVSSHS